MLRILHNTSIDFIGKRKLAAILVGLFIIPGLVLIAVSGFRYSIEFTGGTLVQLRFAQAPDVGDVRSALTDAGMENVEIQTFGAPNEIVIRAQDEKLVAEQAGGAESVAVQIGHALDAKFGANAYTEVLTEAVGPRVGSDLRRNAAIAVLISFAVTLAYLAWRFEWRLSSAALLATLHDILATLAFIKYMDIEISLFVVGGILTVLGYSLTDTVVVFDRLRELLRTERRQISADTLNLAVNQTLPRTVMTGSTVIACLLAMIIFGGAVIRPFSLVLLFGIIVGTFSSIYVASPLLLWIERKWPRQSEASRRAASAKGGPSSEQPSRARQRA